MIAKRQIWSSSQAAGVWAGKYKNSHNLLHWHYDCELLYVEKGSIDVFCEKRKHALAAGDALYVDSGQVHYMQAKEPETVLIVIIFNYNIVKPYLGRARLAYPKLEGNYPVPTVYANLRNILLAKRPFCGGEAAREVLGLMLEIFRGERLAERIESDTAKSFKLLLEDVNAKYEDYTFENAAAFMGMSDGYFSRYFRAATGTTFSQYLNFVRTDNAVRLLHEENGLSVTEISERCGFGTVRNFNRIFKGLTGYTPKRLPRDFVLDEKFSCSGDEAFNPTLYDCELIESGE